MGLSGVHITLVLGPFPPRIRDNETYTETLVREAVRAIPDQTVAFDAKHDKATGFLTVASDLKHSPRRAA